MSSRGKKKKEFKMIQFIQNKTDAEFTRFIRKLNPAQYMDLRKFCHENGLIERLIACTIASPR